MPEIKATPEIRMSGLTAVPEMTMPKVWQLASVLMFIGLFNSGCEGMFEGPLAFVRIRIVHPVDDSQIEQLKKKLSALADGGRAQSVSVTTSNKKTSITIGPVEDAQGFANKIDFGEVARVEGREIYFSFDENLNPQGINQ